MLLGCQSQPPHACELAAGLARPRQIETKGYAGDVDRDISTLEELGAKWEADLHPDQKVYMLIIRAYVLPQLLVVTRERKEAARPYCT